MPMGYMGSGKIDGVDVLLTGGNLSIVNQRIFASGAQAMGWKNAGPGVNALDIVRYEGSLEIELTTDVWGVLAVWGVDQRAFTKGMSINPDGSNPCSYTDVYNTSLGVSCSQGGLVTSTVGGMAFGRTCSGGAGYLATATGTGYTGGSPIPYWSTTASVAGATGEAVDWSFDLSQNTLPVYTCRGTRGVSIVMQGTMDATGSASLYNDTGFGNVDPDTVSGFSASFGGTITINNGVFDSDSFEGGDANSAVFRTFSVKGTSIGGVAPCTLG